MSALPALLGTVAMGLVEHLERRIGGFYIPNLPLFIVAAHVLIGLLAAGDPSRLAPLMLIPQKVAAEGEFHRLFSFIFVPGTLNLMLLVLFSYFFYFFASAAENALGGFRFNLLFFGSAFGYVVAAGIFMLFPTAFPEGYYLPLSSHYLHMVVILAFCILFPKYEIYYMFVLRLEARWIGVIDALFIAHGFLFGTASDRVLILCALGSFTVLFWNRCYTMVHNRFRRKKFQRDLREADPTEWDDEDDDEDEDEEYDEY